MATGSYASPKAHSGEKLLLKTKCYQSVCEMLDNVCDINREVYFMGDLNIDWLSSSCPLKKKLKTLTITCNLIQFNCQPTWVVINSTERQSSTCIEHISFLFGPVRWYHRMGPQCLLTPPVSYSSIYAAVANVSGG